MLNAPLPVAAHIRLRIPGPTGQCASAGHDAGPARGLLGPAAVEHAGGSIVPTALNHRLQGVLEGGQPFDTHLVCHRLQHCQPRRVALTDLQRHGQLGIAAHVYFKIGNQAIEPRLASTHRQAELIEIHIGALRADAKAKADGGITFSAAIRLGTPTLF